MLSARAASSEDVDFMWSMLFYASRAHEQPEASVASIRLHPGLNRYLRDWGREGDLGLIVTDSEVPVAAAWLRRFARDESHLVTYVAPDVPELAIAVDPNRTGQGIGSFLLSRLLSTADRDEVPAVVLSAREDNPAVQLYLRFGFVETDRIGNSVGTSSLKMIRERTR